MSNVLEKVKIVKHSGADWLAKQVPGMSPLGIKVANVLGQVHLGVYHISRDVLRDRSIWANPATITLSVYGEICTFDNPLLTLLVLACKAARVHVSISGIPRRGYLRLKFVDGEADSSVDVSGAIDYFSCVNLLAGIDLTADCSRDRRVKDRLEWVRDGKDHKQVDISQAKAISFAELDAIIAAAHQSCTRIGVCGTGGNRLGLRFSSRERTGYFCDRHPTLEQAAESFLAYTSIDFSEVAA